GYRSRVWKAKLQELSDELNMIIHVSHFPPGTSKWNKIEHRLFCYITKNWRGKPLRTFETVVDLIGNTRTDAGLRVRAKLDKRKYPLGVKISDDVMQELNLQKDDFHGDWNYSLLPRS
ncbi:ISAzo13 family transposase, partial [Myxococcota bacterium]